MLLLIIILSACKQTEQSLGRNIIMENEQQDISYSFKNPNTGAGI